ncbi:MAG: hypothetical protein HRT87_01150 [Legionellales bacterium]|nr:hypothetical protein [Legionellales bacterium]
MFNGIGANRLKKLLKNSIFTTDLLILDTCFSSSFIQHFVDAGVILPGGKIICAHGECQGYTQAIKDADEETSLSDSFGKLLEAPDELGAKYNSLSIYVHPKSSTESGTLYVRKYDNREEAVETARFLGIKDKIKNILKMEKYLRRKNIKIVPISKQALKNKFKKHLEPDLSMENNLYKQLVKIYNKQKGLLMGLVKKREAHVIISEIIEKNK